jgi:RNA-binding protein
VWSKETLSDSEGTTIEKKKLRALQSRSREMDATIWIGKEGVTDDLLKHVFNQLKVRQLVKIKVHKSALTETETMDLAQRVSHSTESILVETMGHTFTVYKRRQLAETAAKTLKTKSN